MRGVSLRAMGVLLPAGQGVADGLTTI